MTSCFDELILRRGSHAHKWDAAADPAMLPMWVADMDFKTAPAVIEALEARARHGVFGYTQVPERYFQTIQTWFHERHNFELDPRQLLFTTGVVPALSAIIQGLCQPDAGVIVQTPAYNRFFSSIRNSQCRQISSPLLYQNGEYRMDFADLERQAADPNNTLMLLCNPHNPVGRCWSADELRRVGDICIQHDVTVVADEIHCELTLPGFRYRPFASLGERYLQHSVTCTSPSKAFNLSGLQVANILAADDDKRRLIDRQLNINGVCEISPFAVEAVMAAYGQGAAWLDELRAYLADNYHYLLTFFREQLPMLKVLPLEATYLVWVDISALNIPSVEMTEQLLQQHQLWLNEGTIYGAEGEGFVRINIATPRARLQEGLTRLKAAFNEGGVLAGLHHS